MMNDVAMRKATAEDSEFAYRARRAAFQAYVERNEGWKEEEQRPLHERRFGAQDFRVIQAAGADVGVVAVVVTPGGVEVKQLFLLPEYQGRGIGRRCLELICEEARLRSLPVRLRVMKANPRARAFFQRLGFARTGETATHVLLERGP